MNLWKRNILARPLVFLVLTSSAFSLIACQSENADLFESAQPSLEASVQDTEHTEVETPSVNVETEDVAEPPAIEAFKPPEFTDPPTFQRVEPIEVELVEQVISLVDPKTSPKLDLLFVMDDSNSMEDHQIRVSQGMDQFAEKLSQHSGLLDYRVAVTPIYDSTRYFKDGTYGPRPLIERVSEWNRSPRGGIEINTKRNFYRLGTLIPLRSPSDGIENYVELDAFYATSQTPSEILEQTLKIGSQVWCQDDETDCEVPRNTFNNPTNSNITVKEAIGPVREEILSPMIAALNPGYVLFNHTVQDHYRAQYPESEETGWVPPPSADPQANERWRSFISGEGDQIYHPNFVRPDAHLGVVFVTDTIDHSVNVNAEMAAEALRLLKDDEGGYSKILTYGVLHKNSVTSTLQNAYPEVWNTAHCNLGNKVDQDIRNQTSNGSTPHTLEAFLNMTRGSKELGKNIINLCYGTGDSTFGEKLAQIADDMFQQSVFRGEYRLKKPALNGIKQVYYKNNPEQKVSSCGKASKGELCWKLIRKRGVYKIVLENQVQLGQDEVVAQWEVINPSEANSNNTHRVGR